jgi:hypothetical protein
LKRAGALYAGALVFSQLVQLYVNIGLVTDSADAMGLPAGVTKNEAESPLLKPLEDFRQDNDIIALTQASLDADTLKMAAALPAGSRAYERHVTGLDRWITALQRGAVLSKKVIQVADIAMIAISIYQVAKMPVVPAGGSQAPPTILGTLPGGVAVGSAVSLPSLARALEAIRKLVAIGALDGALVAGVGSLGGGSGIAVPELQRPTSLSVQVPGGSGSGTGGSTPQTVNWTAHGGKHVAKSGVPWKQIVESTTSGPAKYKPGTAVEALERKVWAEGTAATNGRQWKVMEFPDEIGASGGSSSRWVRVEESGGTIHGHPITLKEFLRLTR